MQFILAFIPQALFLIVLNFLAKYAYNKSTEQLSDAHENSIHSQNAKDRNRYLQTYFEVWQTLNVKKLAGVATDLFYHSTAAMVKLYTRLGLRRELGFKTPPRSYGINGISVQQGKVAWCSQMLRGDYLERLVDSTTGRVLREKDYKNTDLVMSMNKNPDRQRGQAQCCFGCGTQLSVDGELFLCPNCGASYTSDSYDWVMNIVSAVPPPGNYKFQTVVTLFHQSVMLLPLLGLVAVFLPVLNIPFFILLLLMTATILGYGVFGRWYYSALKKLEKYDRLCSMLRVSDRVQYLLRHFWQCRSSDPAAMRQFMDEAAYQKWRQEDTANTGNHILDYDLDWVGMFHSFTVSGGRQHMRIWMPLKLWVFNEQTRTLKTVNRNISFGIYRNEQTRYQNQMTAEAIICPGCGMSINLTAAGKCDSCGTAYDIADYDWKIEYMNDGFYL